MEKLETLDLEFDEMRLNMGPQHPSTHGVLRLHLILSGEIVKKVTPYVGYLHRGVEKLAENLTYIQFIPIMDRNDYLAPMHNELAYVLALEKLAGIEVPKKAQYLRVFTSELQRISSHLVWLGTFGLDLGGALGGGSTLFLYTFRERETILDFIEELTGSRFHPHFNQIGGVRYDLPPGLDRRVMAFMDKLETRIDEYEEMFEGNAVFIERSKGVGVISKELAMSVGVSGPVIRGSGIPYDVRKHEPYCSFEEFDFEIPIGENGDVYDRFKVRINEMRQSIRIIRQALEGMPDGPIASRMPVKVAAAFKPPKGEAYAHVESARGDLGVYVVSDGSPKPYRLKIRAPSFSNLAVLPHILPGHKIADIVSILGSLDPVFGDVDR